MGVSIRVMVADREKIETAPPDEGSPGRSTGMGASQPPDDQQRFACARDAVHAGTDTGERTELGDTWFTRLLSA
ncbi:hypothetical protein [Streptomyces lavendofoliae]|uniref:hypothetical protein n=1 Tax=Streptomyces lavendofoliae TaxID=67314 RepID=UPI003D941168